MLFLLNSVAFATHVMIEWLNARFIFNITSVVFGGPQCLIIVTRLILANAGHVVA